MAVCMVFSPRSSKLRMAVCMASYGPFTAAHWHGDPWGIGASVRLCLSLDGGAEWRLVRFGGIWCGIRHSRVGGLVGRRRRRQAGPVYWAGAFFTGSCIARLMHEEADPARSCLGGAGAIRVARCGAPVAPRRKRRVAILLPRCPSGMGEPDGRWAAIRTIRRHWRPCRAAWW
jgi:hypothetical protein